jgi:hypothetical protein
MRLIKQTLSVLAICLCSFGYAGSKPVEPHRQINTGVNHEVSEVVASIAAVVEVIGNDLDYKFMRGYVTGDEWSEEERSKLLIDRAYYSLLIIDKENPQRHSRMHANFKGYISAVVLLFHNADLAASEVARLKAEYMDNSGVELIKSDVNGFQIKGDRRSYAVVVHGAKVVLLQEAENLRIKNLMTMAERLEKDAW